MNFVVMPVVQPRPVAVPTLRLVHDRAREVRRAEVRAQIWREVARELPQFPQFKVAWVGALLPS